MDVETVGYKAVFTKTLKVVCGLLLVKLTGVLRLCNNCETKARVKGGVPHHQYSVCPLVATCSKRSSSPAGEFPFPAEP